MLRRVALVRTDDSEERFTSIIRMTRIGEPGTLAVTSNRRTLRSNFKCSVSLECDKFLLILASQQWGYICDKRTQMGTSYDKVQSTLLGYLHALEPNQIYEDL
jgi:hypothetical protein